MSDHEEEWMRRRTEKRRNELQGGEMCKSEDCERRRNERGVKD